MAPSAANLAKNLVQYLDEQGMYEQLPALVSELQAELDRKQEITVLSAQELNHADQARVTQAATEHWGEHPVQYLVDPTLVTGILLRFRDQVLDLSGAAQLTDLKQALS